LVATYATGAPVALGWRRVVARLLGQDAAVWWYSIPELLHTQYNRHLQVRGVEPGPEELQSVYVLNSIKPLPLVFFTPEGQLWIKLRARTDVIGWDAVLRDIAYHTHELRSIAERLRAVQASCRLTVAVERGTAVRNRQLVEARAAYKSQLRFWAHERRIAGIARAVLRRKVAITVRPLAQATSTCEAVAVHAEEQGKIARWAAVVILKLHRYHFKVEQEQVAIVNRQLILARTHYITHWRGPVVSHRGTRWGHDLDDPWREYSPEGVPARRRRRIRRREPALRYYRQIHPADHSTVLAYTAYLDDLVRRQQKAQAALTYWRALATRFAALDTESAGHNWRLGTRAFGARYPGDSPLLVTSARSRCLRDLRSRLPCQCHWCKVRDGDAQPRRVLADH
jgi:hypothetical protein